MWLKMDYPKCEIFRNKPQVLVSSKWHISLSILFVTIAGVDLLHCECSRPEIWVSDKYATVQLPFITTTFLFSLRLNLLSQQLAKAVTKSTSKTPASKMVFCALLNIFKNTDYLNQWSSTTTTLGALLYCFQNWRACMKQKRKLKTRNEVACSLLGHARFISECRLPKSILVVNWEQANVVLSFLRFRNLLKRDKLKFSSPTGKYVHNSSDLAGTLSASLPVTWINTISLKAIIIFCRVYCTHC